jgi:hypothetical protein
MIVSPCRCSLRDETHALRHVPGVSVQVDHEPHRMIGNLSDRDHELAAEFPVLVVDDQCLAVSRR